MSMFFKNLQICRLPENWNMCPDFLEERLTAQKLRPCASHEMVSRGWVEPCGDYRFLCEARQQWLMALGVESRLLPASVVRQEAEARAEKLAEKQGYGLGRAQIKELCGQVAQELLPRAFIRQRRTFLWIDPANGWLGIDTPSQAQAGEALHCLLKTVAGFPARPLRTNRSPASAMADWLASGPPSGFTVDQDCELRSASEEKSAVRYACHPLDGSEIRGHLAAGKLPVRLALTFNDHVSFVLTDKMELKRIRFLGAALEDLGDEADAAARFYAEFTLMADEFARLLPALAEALGGERP